MTWPPRIIVVPIDFSTCSLEALDVARERLVEGGRIELVYVLEHLAALHPAALWEPDDVADEDRLDQVDRALEHLARDRGITRFAVTTATTVGNPAFEIARIATARDADLIVVSSHGRSGLARVALGSVAERIVRYSQCPVLVVKATTIED